MANALNSTGSIATYISNNLPDLPAGVSGNLVIIADLARQHVANYTGVNIGSTNIPDQYQPPILDYAMADTLDMFMAQAGGTEIRLGELQLNEGGLVLSPQQYRILGDLKLRALGRNLQFAQSLS